MIWGFPRNKVSSSGHSPALHRGWRGVLASWHWCRDGVQCCRTQHVYRGFSVITQASHARASIPKSQRIWDLFQFECSGNHDSFIHDSFNQYSLCISPCKTHGIWQNEDIASILHTSPIGLLITLQGITLCWVGKAENLLFDIDEKAGPYWSHSCICPLSLSHI